MINRNDLSVLCGVLFTIALCFYSSEIKADMNLQPAYLSKTQMMLAQQEAPALALPSPAATQETEQPGWAVNCTSTTTDKGLECQLSQMIVTQQGDILANVMVRVPADKQNLEAIVQLPLGIFLPAGATLKVDDNVPLQLNFRACHGNGCYARGPVSPEILADLQKGKQLNVSFKNLAEKPIDVSFSLDEFAKAYAKI